MLCQFNIFNMESIILNIKSVTPSLYYLNLLLNTYKHIYKLTILIHEGLELFFIQASFVNLFIT